jgi:hypothetical protein
VFGDLTIDFNGVSDESLLPLGVSDWKVIEVFGEVICDPRCCPGVTGVPGMKDVSGL